MVRAHKQTPAPERWRWKKQISWRNSACSRNAPPSWVGVQLKCSHCAGTFTSKELNSLFRMRWRWILSVLIRKQCGYKGDGTRRKGGKISRTQRGSGVNPHCQGRRVIWDGRIISTIWPLTCLVAPGGLSPAVSDPPLCSVLQMGGGAIQTRAAGVHGGVPAAGLGTTNNDTHYTHPLTQRRIFYHTWEEEEEGHKSDLNEKHVHLWHFQNRFYCTSVNIYI